MPLIRRPVWRRLAGKPCRKYAVDLGALEAMELLLLEYAYRRAGQDRDLAVASQTLKVSETYVTVALARLEANHYLEPDAPHWKLTPKGALAAQALASSQRSKHYVWFCLLLCSIILASVIYGVLMTSRMADVSLPPTLVLVSVAILYGAWMLRNHFTSRSAENTHRLK